MKKLVLAAVLMQVFFAAQAREITGKVLSGYYYAPDARGIHLAALDLNDDGTFNPREDVLIAAECNSPVYTGFRLDVKMQKNSLITFSDDNARHVTRWNALRIAETNKEVPVGDVLAINGCSVLEGEFVSAYSDRQKELAFPIAYARREQERKVAAYNQFIASYYATGAENERLKAEVTNRNLELEMKSLEIKSLDEENRKLREKVRNPFGL